MRQTFRPYWRINKSQLPLGIVHSDIAWTVCVFVVLVGFLDEFIISGILTAIYLIALTSIKNIHRKGAPYELIMKKLRGERVYVIRKH